MPEGRDYGLPDAVACPFCDRRETELHSPFGSALSVSTYWCRRCRTAFEWVKWDDRGGGDGSGPTPNEGAGPPTASEPDGPIRS